MTSVTFAGDILQYTGAGSAARALFPANDLLDWRQLGLCPSAVTCLPSTVTATSSRGIVITIIDTGGFSRIEEGTISWGGTFKQVTNCSLTACPLKRQRSITLNKLVAGIGLELGYTPERFQRPCKSSTTRGRCFRH
jgi:hypothetical protein